MRLHGMIRYQKTGELFQGKHKAMISKEEFDKVQALLRRKGLKPAPHTKEFAHTGQITCSECGCSVTAEDKTQVRCNKCKIKFAYPHYQACPVCKIKVEKLKEKTHLFYTYYHCTKRRNTDDKKCRQPSVKGEDLEQQIFAFFQTINIQQKYVDWALEYLRNHPAAGKLKTKEAAITHNKQRLENVNKSLSKLTDMRLADLISDEEFKAKKQALEEEKSKCEAFLERTEKRATEAASKAEGLLTFAERAMREYKKGDKRKQRLLISELGSNLFLKDKKLLIQKDKALALLEKSTKVISEINSAFEPAEHGVNKRRNASFDTLRPLWLGSWDSNPGPIGYTLP
jgi:hypothetical protein